jgi:hypothetical protein
MNPQQIFEFLTANAGGKIACFGSRETPQHVLDLMYALGARLATLGFQIASGHCQGADWAWEQGVCSTSPSQMLVMLPWASYNLKIEDNMPIHPESKVFVLNKLPPGKEQALIAEAKLYHGAWEKLSNGGRALQGRNMMIGRESFMGLCYMNPAKSWGGGSGQAYKYLTTGPKVPVWDFSKREQYDSWSNVLELLS